MQTCLRTSLERGKTEIFKPRIADRIALGNSVASAFFFPVSHLSLWRGKWFSRRGGKCSSEAGVGLQQWEWYQSIGDIPAPSWEWMSGIAAGSKAASGGKQGCSSRVCGTGMEQAKAAEQGQQQRKPNRQGTKSVWNDSGLDGVARAECQEGSSRILLVICKTEEISQHRWVSADGACRLRKI